MRRSSYPFSAIVANDDVKKALLIILVNPRAGGLLISGAKGTAKSTIVRAAAPFTVTGKIVELPLGATEDMVFGSLDMEKALKDGTRQLQAGLLHRAADTILYMDEVNLLRQDFLMTVLDSAASGFFELERDGLSCRKAVSYTPVGTMNPEEGTLSSAVLDRFGLFVSLSDGLPVDERVSVMRRVLDFEKRPQDFIKIWQEEENAIQETITKARNILASVEVSDAMLELVAEFCRRSYCRGNRADLYLLEAARALAALANRRYIMPQDIETAALFVLPHRMGKPPEKAAPPNEEGENPPEDRKDQEDRKDEEKDNQDDDRESPDDNEENKTPPENEAEENKKEEPPEEKEESESEKNPPPEDDPTEGEMTAGDFERIFAALAKLMATGLDIAAPDKEKKREGSGKRSLTRTDSRLGRYVRANLPRRGKTLDLAFDATLRAAAPHQAERRKKTKEEQETAIILKKTDYRDRIREKRVGANIIFLVDASGSMAAAERMRAVKSVIISLLQESYQKRDRVGLIAFRRDRGEVLLPVTRSIDLAEKLLRDLPTGGRTPLAEGLDTALSLVYGLMRRDANQETVIILITDGRPNAAYAHDDPVKRAYEAAEKFRRAPVLPVVIDTENDYFKFGIAKELAKRMGANYYSFRRLSKERVLRIVKNFIP